MRKINCRVQSQQGPRSLPRTRARTSVEPSRWDPELMLRVNRSETLEIYSSFMISVFFFTIISELYYHIYLLSTFAELAFSRTQELVVSFACPPPSSWWSFICHSLQYKSKVFLVQTTCKNGSQINQKFLCAFFVLQFTQGPFHSPDIKDCSLAK